MPLGTVFDTPILYVVTSSFVGWLVSTATFIGGFRSRVSPWYLNIASFASVQHIFESCDLTTFHCTVMCFVALLA